MGPSLNHDASLHDLEDPPAPSGNPLLDNNELQYLTTFLLGVNRNNHTSNHRIPPAFSLPEGLGGVYTENWLMPPEVVGHNVSYENANHEDGMFMSDSMMSGPATEQFQRHHDGPLNYSDAPTQDDVLVAARALTGAGQYGMSFGQAQQTMYPMAPAQNHAVVPHDNHARQTPTSYPMASQNHAVRSAPRVDTSTQHQFFGVRPDQFSPNQHMSSPLTPNQNHLDSHGMMLGTPGGSQFYGQQRQRAPLGEVQFGSDTSFNRRSFVPESMKDTTEAISAAQMATLGCLKRNVSQAPTRATSPVSWEPPSPNMRRPSAASPRPRKSIPRSPLTPDEPANGEAGPARKRRKSSKVDADDETSQPRTWSSLGAIPPMPAAATRPTATALPRRRKLPEESSTPAPTAAAMPKKSRKSAAANAANAINTTAGSGRRTSTTSKTPRENLSDEQKRANHIKSEQKRRNYIKEGYDGIQAVVPALAGGGFSKAAMLTMTADFVEDLLTGNQRLKSKLVAAGGGMGSPAGGAVAV